MNIDWSKAPEGATHFIECTDAKFLQAFFAVESEDRYAMVGAQTFFRKRDEGRPGWIVTSRPVTWNGEGLPPVGVDARLKKECKFTEGTRLDSFPAGTDVYVGGHANFGGSDLAVIIVKGRHFCGTIIPELLEPSITPDQIAAEEKQREIQDILAIVGPYWETCAEALYEAGYRKP